MSKEFDSKAMNETNEFSYNVQITNGTGEAKVSDGEYSVVADVDGYDNATLTPASVTVQAGVTVYDFTISAAGTLNIHVTEEGTSEGTAVQGATFVRCDETGTTTYGDEITTGTDGVASMQYLPYGSGETVYYKQTGSATDHEFDPDVREITLTTQTETVEIANPALVMRTFNLTDAHYDDVVVQSGTLTLTK